MKTTLKRRIVNAARVTSLLIVATGVSVESVRASVNDEAGSSQAGTESAAEASSSITKENPAWKKFLFTEPEPAFYLGFGVSPLAILQKKIGFSANVFQLHWMTGALDWEMVSASFGTTLAEGEEAKSKSFTVRTSPKLRLTSFLSLGPIAGVEYVSFSNLQSQLFRNGFVTPSEPFSSKGLIYGGNISETFSIGDKTKFKANQIFYKQTYSTTAADTGWTYFYNTPALNKDQAAIAPSTVFMLEFSVLY